MSRNDDDFLMQTSDETVFPTKGTSYFRIESKKKKSMNLFVYSDFTITFLKASTQMKTLHLCRSFDSLECASVERNQADQGENQLECQDKKLDGTQDQLNPEDVGLENKQKMSPILLSTTRSFDIYLPKEEEEYPKNSGNEQNHGQTHSPDILG